MASSRRDRKRANKAIGLVDGIRPEVLSEYLATRIICDRCGLDQPYVEGEGCIGALGLHCEGDSGVSPVDFPLPHGLIGRIGPA